MIVIIVVIIHSLLLTVGAQSADRCQIHQRTLNPVRTSIPGLAPIGNILDGEPVAGYYYNANTGCYGYLLQIGGNPTTERYFEPGA